MERESTENMTDTESRAARGIRGVFAALTMAAFWAAIALPGALSVNHDPAASIRNEERSPAPWPGRPEDRAAVEAWPAAFAQWARDHFYGRAALIRIHNRIVLEVLDDSPVPTLVRGRDGWLFFTGESSIENYRRLLHLDDGAAERWRRTIERRLDWFAARGIPYVFVVAPDKHTIHGEMMAARWPRADGPSFYEQWLDRAALPAGLDAFDLRDVLTRAKANGPTYYPLGTHWTTLGGRVTYEAFAARIGRILPKVVPIPAGRLIEKDDPAGGDSWAKRLHLDGILTQKATYPDLIGGWRWTEVPHAGPNPNDRTTEIADRAAPRAVMFHDSFAQSWMAFLSEHFSRISYAWQKDIDWNLVEREKPDILLHEIVERFLTIPPNDPEPKSPAWAPWAGEYRDARGETIVTAIKDDRLIVSYGGKTTALRRTGTGVFAEDGAEKTRAEIRFPFEAGHAGRTLTLTRKPFFDGRTFVRIFPETAAAAARLLPFAGRYRAGAAAVTLVFTGDAMVVFDAEGRLAQRIVLDDDGRPMIENSPMLTVELSRRPDGARTLAIGGSPHRWSFRKMRDESL